MRRWLTVWRTGLVLGAFVSAVLSCGSLLLGASFLTACSDDAGAPGGPDSGGAGDAVAPPDALADAAGDGAGPGLDVPDAAAPVGVVVNEVVAAAADGGPDWIELYNGGAAAADIGGWVLRDDDDTHAWTVPDGTTVPAGGFLVLSETDGAGGAGFEFGLGAADRVRLFDPAGALVDETAWTELAAPAGQSWGRWPDGSGPFATLEAPTPGQPNARPAPPPDVVGPPDAGPDVPSPPDAGPTDVSPGVVPPIVVNEIMARDPLGGEDWAELYNLGTEPVDVGGFRVTDEPTDPIALWETLPAGLVVPAGGFLVLEARTDFTFAFNSDEDFAIALPDGTPIDQTAWLDGQAPAGGSWGRYPDGTGRFATLPEPTRGAANAAPAGL